MEPKLFEDPRAKPRPFESIRYRGDVSGLLAEVRRSRRAQTLSAGSCNRPIFRDGNRIWKPEPEFQFQISRIFSADRQVILAFETGLGNFIQDGSSLNAPSLNSWASRKVSPLNKPATPMPECS